MAEYNFSKCMYDISILTPDGLLMHYPELNAYEEFVAAKKDEEIKLVVCLVDSESPFLKVKDLKQKLLSIFSYLHLDLSENKELFDEVLEYKNQRIISMCAVYLQMQNNHDFTYWWNMNMLYYSLMNQLGKARGEEDVSRYVDRQLKIQKQAEPIKNDLLSIESDLFSDSKMKMAMAKAKLTTVRTYAEMHSEENTVI